MILTFTGPSELTRSQELAVARRMDELAEDKLQTWRSGCAFGVDTMAARHAVMVGMLHTELYVPVARHNKKLVKELEGAATIIRCRHGREPYRIRNQMMIDGLLGTKADLLVAFLKSDKFYRSGEWMTVNIAKQSAVPFEVNVI